MRAHLTMGVNPNPNLTHNRTHAHPLVFKGEVRGKKGREITSMIKKDHSGGAERCLPGGKK